MFFFLIDNFIINDEQVNIKIIHWNNNDDCIDLNRTWETFWPCSIVLSDILIKLYADENNKNKIFFELGSGISIPSVICSHLNPLGVYITGKN